MDKVDFKKKYKNLYAPSALIPEIVEVPGLQYAVLSGTGDPNTSRGFAMAVEALFGFSYTVSMSYKGNELNIPGFYNYVVPPLEGVWDIAEGTDFSQFSKDNLLWTIGILQPDFVTHGVFKQAKELAAKKKGNTLISEISLLRYNDGLCCTYLHQGSYDDEPASFDKMHEYVEKNGYKRAEKTHREIYLSDFRNTKPEKLKTVLRFKIE